MILRSRPYSSGSLALAVLGVFAVLNTVHAAPISLTNSVAGIQATAAAADAAGVLFTTDAFDMSGGNAVAFLVTTEGAGDSALRGATFAGQAMDSVNVEDSGAGDQTATIFWLIDPAATSGAFSFVLDPDYDNEGNGNISHAYSQIALSNVSGVAGVDTERSTSNSNTVPMEVSYTTSSLGGYVLGAMANNDYNNARVISLDYGNPTLDLLSHALEGSSGHFHAHGAVATAGAYTDGYLGQYQRTALATVAFDSTTIVPEPASLAALGMLGVLGALRRRK